MLFNFLKTEESVEPRKEKHFPESMGDMKNHPMVKIPPLWIGYLDYLPT
jgi:hypothetical protein